MTTRDEVLAMAKKCGAKEVLSYNRFSGPVVLRILDTELERFAALVAAAEREECAKVCEKRAETRWEEYGVTEDDTGASYYPRSHEWCDTADEEANDCATAIRDRLKPKFSEVGCSQCGQIFGPGNSGYSHCSDHSHIRARSAK